MTTPKKRIIGWYFFDWATQPYHTVLLTFVFGPFFAATATGYFAATGLEEQAADARAQSLWSLCLTISGLIVGLGAPFLGALADASGRRMRWIAAFSALYIIGAMGLWGTWPDGTNLIFALIMFGLGFIGAEYALIFVNAQLPDLADEDDVGRVSGSGFAFGYLGGLIALILVLTLLVEQGNGKTLINMPPLFGLLDPALMEGTRAAGPFVALWFAIFMVPYFLWMRDTDASRKKRSAREALAHVAASIKGLRLRPSLASFLGGSMLYRDALNGLYGFGGTYALLVLNWDVIRVGKFGIVMVISAAALSWIGGRLDTRLGPKPVIVAATLGLVLVCTVLSGISPDTLFGASIGTGSVDLVFMACGIFIGGLGGVLQAASRSLMVRHTDTGAETEGFGLYGLTGRATAFLAPALIGLVTAATGDVRNGVMPLIGLFILGLFLLRWTNAQGDRAKQ